MNILAQSREGQRWYTKCKLNITKYMQGNLTKYKEIYFDKSHGKLHDNSPKEGIHYRTTESVTKLIIRVNGVISGDGLALNSFVLLISATAK